MHPIDFVIPWVDGSDIEWQKQRNKYAGDKVQIKEVQYRDWGILRYWFRCVELYAPWVNKIHFVTCNQIPAWLNTEHPKLSCVNHEDYIPAEYLPTFSSHVIELNFHRIPNLSEHFVYFNDDMFLNSAVEPQDFFVDEKPCESPIMSILSPSVVGDPFVHYLCNDITMINQHFSKREVVKNAWNKWYSPKYGKYILKNIYFAPGKHFSALQNFHVASSMCKSVFKEVWELEPELLHGTCSNKFRGLNDVNQYVMSYYNICKGNFIPRNASFGKFYVIGHDSQALYEDISSGHHKLICMNDNPGELDVNKEMESLIRVLEKAYPHKSSFEK